MGEISGGYDKEFYKRQKIANISIVVSLIILAFVTADIFYFANFGKSMVHPFFDIFLMLVVVAIIILGSMSKRSKG
jgi:hypothetical protein